MKRILTIVLFASITLVAATQAYAIGEQPNLKSLMQKERLSNAVQASQNLPHRVATMKTSEQVSQIPSKTSTKIASKANAMAIDTVELYFDSFYDDPLFYPLEDEDGNIIGGDWYIVIRNERYQFIFDIYGGTPQDPSGTYTEEDLDIWFSWCAIPEADGKTSYYETCDLVVKAERLSDNLTKYVVDATVVTTLGVGGEVNGAFKIHAEHETITPTFKLDVAILNCVVTPEEDRFRLAGKNDSIEIDMTLFSDFGVEGYYTHKLIDEENTKMIYRGKSYEIMEMEGVIYTAEMTTGGVAYVAMMEILTSDTCFFNIAMEAPIVPTDTIEVVCSNMVIDDTYGFTDATITVVASNKEYSILAGYNDTKITAPATYTGQQAMVYLTELKTEKEIASLQCSIEVDGNANDGYKVTVEMLGNDHKYYIMNLAWDIPEPIRTVVLDFPACAKAAYYIDPLGLEELQLANYNEEYSVAFDILHIDQIMGEEFTEANLWIEQGATFVVEHTKDYDLNVDLAKVNGKVWQKNDTTFLSATAIGFDSVKYEVSMFYAVPIPTETITYEFDAFADDEVVFTNALPQGIFILEAMSADGDLMATVQVNGIETETLDGTYYRDGIFTKNDFDANNTFVEVWNEDQKEFETYSIHTGEMTIQVDENKHILAVASFICEDEKQYNLTFKVKYERAHLPYDTEEGGVDYTYKSDAQIEIIDWLEGYGLIYLELVPADFSHVTAMYFAAEAMDPVIGIPAGVYPINSSFKPGSVIASKGIGMDGYPLESYFCTLQVEEDEDGEMALYYDQLYCMVDGTVKVENMDGKLRVQVNAVNSYDVPIKLLYCGTIDAVENVAMQDSIGVKKQFVDGQLYIIKNGTTYTTTGVQVK